MVKRCQYRFGKIISCCLVRPEGVKRPLSQGHGFDCIASSCTYDDYLRVKNLRKGNYWPGAANLLRMMRSVPKASIATLVQVAINDVVDNFAKGITFD